MPCYGSYVNTTDVSTTGTTAQAARATAPTRAAVAGEVLLCDFERYGGLLLSRDLILCTRYLGRRQEGDF